MKTKAKILVVEDETPVAMLMVSALTGAGFSVQAAHNGRKMMELASETKFDLIALEVDLPDINGFEICEELKQRHIARQTPIVLISERSFDEDSRRSLEVGAADYITKLFQAAKFVQRIISVMESQKQWVSAF